MICQISYCEKVYAPGVFKRSMCNAHYLKWRKYGDPEHIAERKSLSKETRQKISNALVGNTNGRFRVGILHTDEAKKKMSISAKPGIARGPRDLPEECSYGAAHIWLRRHHVKTGNCEVCSEKRHTQWANISGNYKRNRDDYWELCVPCHKLFDYSRLIEQADPKIMGVIKMKLKQLKDTSE